MIKRITDWLLERKITVAIVGGALVIATAWGSCTVDPELPALEVEDAEPADAEPASNADETEPVAEPAAAVTGENVAGTQNEEAVDADADKAATDNTVNN